MKRINIWNALLIILFLSACSEETITGIATEEQPVVPVSLNVQIDNRDENLIRVGGDQQIPAGYQLRYIVEIYTTMDKLITREVRIGSTSYGTPFSFDNVRLPINDQYVAVCWADLIPTGVDKTNLYYNADKLTAIHQNLTGCTNPDLLDAYAGKLAFEIDDRGVQSEVAVTLKRPLVQILLENLRLENAVAETYYMNYQEVLTTYNAFTQKVVTATSDKTTRNAGVKSYVATPQSNFTFKDYVFMDDVARQLSFVVTGNGKDYSKANLPLYAPLTKPNVQLKLRGENDYLQLEEVSLP